MQQSVQEWGVIAAPAFDLALTLRSGQFFRYYEQEDHALLLTKGTALRIKQIGETLHYSGAEEAFVRSLFLLDSQYEEQILRLQRDEVLQPLLQRYPGLRLMQQDLHEAILGFICSSQSNIPKIRMNLHLLANSCGETIDGHAHLPLPGIVLDHDVVRNAKTGYRAKFLVQTNHLLTEELLAALRQADYATSHRMVCELPGIGPKIADCICLFALAHGEAFPVDVHIMRAMRHLFPRSRLSSEERVKRFAQKRWGPDAGLAQQFIFQWARDSQRQLLGSA